MMKRDPLDIAIFLTILVTSGAWSLSAKAGPSRRLASVVVQPMIDHCDPNVYHCDCNQGGCFNGAPLIPPAPPTPEEVKQAEEAAKAEADREKHMLDQCDMNVYHCECNQGGCFNGAPLIAPAPQTPEEAKQAEEAAKAEAERQKHMLGQCDMNVYHCECDQGGCFNGAPLVPPTPPTPEEIKKAQEEEQKRLEDAKYIVGGCDTRVYECRCDQGSMCTPVGPSKSAASSRQ